MFQVTDYLHSVFAKRKSPNKLKVTMVIGAKPWLADTQHALYEAGKAAVKRGTKATVLPPEIHHQASKFPSPHSPHVGVISGNHTD